MTKEFVPYAEAFELRDVGFDEPCFGRWLVITKWETPTGEIKLQIGVEAEGYDKRQTKAPTFSQAFRWFREKYQIFGGILSEYSYGGQLHAYHVNGKRQSCMSKGDFDSYEEAELACLRKLIEIVKTKQ